MASNARSFFSASGTGGLRTFPARYPRTKIPIGIKLSTSAFTQCLLRIGLTLDLEPSQPASGVPAHRDVAGRNRNGVGYGFAVAARTDIDVERETVPDEGQLHGFVVVREVGYAVGVLGLCHPDQRASHSSYVISSAMSHSGCSRAVDATASTATR